MLASLYTRANGALKTILLAHPEKVLLCLVCIVYGGWGGWGWQLLHRVQDNAAEVVQDMNTTLFFDPKTRVR